MKIALFGKSFTEGHRDTIQRLVHKLEASQAQILIHHPFHGLIHEKIKFRAAPVVFHSHEDLKADFLFSIGGDGTFLETLLLVRSSGIPVMGINTGRLGFLSSVASEEVEQAVDAVLKKGYTLDKRSLLRMETSAGLFGETNYALNEITVHKKDSASMIIIHAMLNGQFLNSYWADGLIVSTPTGSTAYSLSCGGPIVMPGSENFVITPVAPHNLTVRPIIISDKDELRLKVEGRNQHVLVSLDSRSATIDPLTELVIRKERFSLNLVKLKHHDFPGTLRTKLNWGLDKRN